MDREAEERDLPLRPWRWGGSGRGLYGGPDHRPLNGATSDPRGADGRRPGSPAVRTILVIGSVEPGEADMAYLLESRGIEVVVIPSLGRDCALRDIHNRLAPVSVIRRERPDVFTPQAKAGALGRSMAALLGSRSSSIRFTDTCCGDISDRRKTSFFWAERILRVSRPGWWRCRIGWCRALRCAEVAPPRTAFRSCPLGFDLTPFAACVPGRGGVLRSQIGVGSDVKLLAIIGRMVPVKGHDTFVAAAAELARARDDVHFVFVGGGELENQIRQDVAHRGLSSRAHFLGWQRELAPIYADLDVPWSCRDHEGRRALIGDCLRVPVV